MFPLRDIDQLHRRGVWGRYFRWVLLLAALVGVMAAGLPQAQAAAPGQTGQARTVVPLGQAVGIKLFAQGVLVVGLSDITTQEGPVSPARACGLQAGDVITHINDDPVNSIEQVQTVLQDLEGDEMELTVLRDETSRDMTTHAVQCSADGAYKLGAWIRDSMAGIGTLTFYEPETGRFGTLGHGISDVDTAAAQGGTPVPVALPQQVHTGPATIRSNVSGTQVEEYTVEILKVYEHTGDSRDLMLKVTDPRLLAQTGGIVQGMSGSPILQDGKLVGAVTHVLIDHADRGYGIFAQRMLEQADRTRSA